MTDTPDDVFSIFDVLETSADDEENGKWFNDVFPETGIAIDLKLRRLGSRASIKARQAISKPYLTQSRNKPLEEKINEKILNQQIVEAILLDWRGIPGAGGVEIPYSAENAKMLISRLTALRDKIVEIALARDQWLAKDRETIVKN